MNERLRDLMRECATDAKASAALAELLEQFQKELAELSSHLNELTVLLAEEPPRDDGGDQ